jgi:hypothetical protein
MCEIVKIQMHFQSDLLIFLLNFVDRCVDLGKTFKKKIISFHLDQVWKKKNGQSWVLLYVTKDDVR